LVNVIVSSAIRSSFVKGEPYLRTSRTGSFHVAKSGNYHVAATAPFS
jgi:hypothetical protein